MKVKENKHSNQIGARPTFRVNAQIAARRKGGIVSVGRVFGLGSSIRRRSSACSQRTPPCQVLRLQQLRRHREARARRVFRKAPEMVVYPRHRRAVHRVEAPLERRGRLWVLRQLVGDASGVPGAGVEGVVVRWSCGGTTAAEPGKIKSEQREAGVRETAREVGGGNDGSALTLRRRRSPPRRTTPPARGEGGSDGVTR
jgi:hypothetical protein